MTFFFVDGVVDGVVVSALLNIECTGARVLQI